MNMNNVHEMPPNYATMYNNTHNINNRPGRGLKQEEGEDLVNPLGAIGTIPPISKSYSLFDTPSSTPSFTGGGVHNSPVMSNRGYSNNFDFHGHLRSTPPPATDYPANQLHNNYGMNQSYGNSTLNDNLYSGSAAAHDQYAQYQKRLALMEAMNKQQQSQNFIGPSEYSSWDLRQDYQNQLRAQALQNQIQQQQQQREFYGLSGRPTVGPPPGLGASGYTNNNQVQSGNVPTADAADDSALQYDPFRSIWNQWNNSSQ